MRKTTVRRFGRRMTDVLFWCCLAALLYFAGQIFLFASFRIPSESMSPGLTGGDCVMVWKPVIGARVFNLFSALEGKKVTIYRLPGVRNIRRNDVLVFHYPYPKRSDRIEMHLLKYYIKRCVALPHDTFYIDNGIYRVRGVADTLGLHLRQRELSDMADSCFRKEIFHAFPQDSSFGWTIRNFGPMHVPGKGDRITVDARNILLYKNLIAYETGRPVVIRDGQAYLGEEPLATYTFTSNYYFMAGDYTLSSYDSRYWGLLPEEYMVGKAAFIWKSKDPASGQWRWKRFLKSIR